MTILGIDLDNTIINYERPIRKLAQELGLGLGLRLNDSSGLMSKKSLRDTIRKECGDLTWQKIQSRIYGADIQSAEPHPGVIDFIQSCRLAGWKVKIISHKTEFSALDPVRTNLRQAAMEFLKDHGFFSPRGIGLDPELDIFFEPDRESKVRRIKNQKCHWFIDDLVETFLEPDFPEKTQSLLFSEEIESRYLGPQFSNWWDISSFLLPEKSIRPILERLLGKSILKVDQIPGGNNNKVFKVFTSNGKKYIAKQYFRTAQDPRCRFLTETSAVSFLSSKLPRFTTRLVSSDSKVGVAVYDFIDGEKLAGPQIRVRDIQACADFLIQLHEISLDSPVATFQTASEAFFDSQSLINNLKMRRARLDRSITESPIDRELRLFLEGPFDSALKLLVERIFKSGLLFVAQAQRTLSPSDFGFHNALVTPSDELIFFDFEYFGWDDPVKMISDFILHPAMQLTPRQVSDYLKFTIPYFKKDPELVARLKCYYPLFGLKWCLIILNEFLPEERARRRFADNSQDSRTMQTLALQQSQLSKSKALLEFVLKNSNDESYFHA